MTINATNGATVNQNSDNNHQSKSLLPALLFTLSISIICDFLVFMGLMWQMDKQEQRADNHYGRIEMKYEGIAKTLKNISDDAKQEAKIAKESSIWLMRNDIIQTIDIHEAKKHITQKQYMLLKDEYAHYVDIGGNHDVKERFDLFTSKIYGTGEIKMTAN